MRVEEINRLAEVDVQEYILKHHATDEKKMVLRADKMLGLSTALLAQQIAARRKAETKLPTFFATPEIVYPPSINLEQCSSEATAKFKAKILRDVFKEKKINGVDLTGGFGVDSFFLSRESTHVDFVEPELGLINLARHNYLKLGATNVNFHHQTAEHFLHQNKKKYDFIFIDPSRRDKNLKKSFRLADGSPNTQPLLSTLFQCTNYVLLKASPWLDLQQGLLELNFVKKIMVIAVANECKELIFLMEKNYSKQPVIETYNLDQLGATIHFFSFTLTEEKNATSVFNEPQMYLYEPNAAIVKAGAFKLVGEKFALAKLHANTHLYTSPFLDKKFPGRIFKINQLKVEPKLLVDKKANVMTRNYPLKPDELKKKLKLTDGGDYYVVAFSGIKKKYVVLATRVV